MVTISEEVDMKILEKRQDGTFKKKNPATTAEQVKESGEKRFVSNTQVDKWDRVENKVDSVRGKGLSTNDYTDTEKLEVAKVKDKVDKMTGKGLSTNDYTDDEKAKLNKHVEDDTSIKHKAEQIELQDTANLFTSSNVEDGMSELFTNVSNGKDLVSGAITDVDDSVVIPTEPSFADLAGAIGGISTGKKWASGEIDTTEGFGIENCVDIKGLDFIPSTVVMASKRSSSATSGALYSDLLKNPFAFGSIDTIGSDFTKPIQLENNTIGNFKLCGARLREGTYKWIAFE